MIYSTDPTPPNVDSLLSEPSETKSFERPSTDVKDHSERFRVKDRKFARQYAHLYAERLWTMRPKLTEAAKEKWGLIPIVLSNGKSILKDQTVTSFTNAEEDAVKLTKAMTFALETKLKDLGTTFVGVKNFQSNVQVSGRIVTGQNPVSATPTAEAIVKLAN